MGKAKGIFFSLLFLLIFFMGQGLVLADEVTDEEHLLAAGFHVEKEVQLVERAWPEEVARFIVVFDSGYTFEYPDAVRGIYVTGHSAGGQRFETLLELLNTTDLNTMVIDIKDDHEILLTELQKIHRFMIFPEIILKMCMK